MLSQFKNRTKKDLIWIWRDASELPKLTSTNCNLNERKQMYMWCLFLLLCTTSLSVHVGVAYGLQPKIDMNSHPEKIRCDQLFGIEHKGCSVLGKLLWKAHSFTSFTLEEAERQSFPRGKYSFVTLLRNSSTDVNNVFYRFTNVCKSIRSKTTWL